MRLSHVSHHFRWLLRLFAHRLRGWGRVGVRRALVVQSESPPTLSPQPPPTWLPPQSSRRASQPGNSEPPTTSHVVFRPDT